MKNFIFLVLIDLPRRVVR